MPSPSGSSIRFSNPVTSAPDPLTVLTDALHGFARALETGRADAVLAAEEELAAAVSALRAADLTLLSRQPNTRARIEDARHKLMQCQAMGAASAGLMAAMAVPAYGRRGSARSVPLPAMPTLASRV